MLGGGMRQAGLIAAAGIFALDHNLPLLKDDNRRAGELARGLAGLPGITLLRDNPASNMVYFDLNDELEMDADQFADLLAENGVLASIEGDRKMRLVTHIWINDVDIDQAIEIIEKVIRSS